MEILNNLRNSLSVYAEWKSYAGIVLIKYIFRHLNELYLRDYIDFARSREFSIYSDDNKTLELKKNLDKQSIKLINTVIDRQKYIYTHNLIATEMFDKAELSLQKKISVRKYKKLYPRIGSYPVETFIYHNGLTLVPQGIVDKASGLAVIDAGAFRGDSAIILSSMYKFGEIFSFEPEDKNFEILSLVKSAYNLTNVQTVKYGLGKSNEYSYTTGEGLGQVLSATKQGRKRVPITSIDIFSKEHALNVGLIKMDIEGSEYDAIVGANAVIKKFKPILLISIYHNPKDFFEIKPMIEKINPKYRFKIRKINPYSLTNEVILIAY